MRRELKLAVCAAAAAACTEPTAAMRLSGRNKMLEFMSGRHVEDIVRDTPYLFRYACAGRQPPAARRACRLLHVSAAAAAVGVF